MGQPEQKRGGFLRTLIKDPSANTLAIGAAAMVPLVAMVGGGVDASRFYMAQSRLQAACDAGALAARRSMDTDNFTTEQKEIGEAFFDENFPEDSFGVEEINKTYIGTTDGEVQGTATAEMPTSLMAMFGYDDFNLKVTCSADINISNTDIMMVLDVTGSMAGSRIAGLKAAAKDFYKTVDEATSDAAQVRYGFVPYNTNVNVGKILYAANPDFMALEHEYSSRIPNITETWDEISLTTGSGYYNEQSPQYQYFSTTAAGYVSESFCAAVYPQYANGIDPFVINNSLDTSTGEIVTQTVDGKIRTTVGKGAQIRLRYGEAGYLYNNGYCRVGNRVFEQVAEVDYTLLEELKEEFESYDYISRTVPLNDLYGDDRITFNTGINGTNVTHFWDGCIEEAATAIVKPNEDVPDTAYDLDINLVPQTEAQKWKPALPSMIHYRYSGSEFSSWTNLPRLGVTENWDATPQYFCPREAQRLREMTKLQFDDYVDSLQANGLTYHDAGMIWGARFISPNGIFATANQSAPNGEAISRHIVFMTDGQLVTSQNLYGRYGIEFWDRRVTDNGTASQQRNNHAARFQAACRAARNENISVWVVAFGTELTQNLVDCATPGRAYEASNSAALSEAFKEIAEKIAALRLTA
jgi:Flp pilus assembly protein TadG